MATKPNDLFRAEAVEYHAGQRDDGRVLRIGPAWTRWTYWLLLALLVVAGAFLAVGRVGEYATGPAAVIAAGRTTLSALAPGVVTSVEVHAGQNVRAGDVLLRFVPSDDLAALGAVERNVLLQPLESGSDSADPEAQRRLATMRTLREVAESHVLLRSIVAPHAGVVGEVRARPGQRVHDGDVLCSVIDEHAPFTLVAALPGYYRPLLRAGMTVKLDLAGFRYVHQSAVIHSVSDSVLSPAEAREVLGPELAESFAITGPTVLVRARLSAQTFRTSEATLRYSDGMTGSAEVRVRDDTILLTLVPSLKALFHHGSG